MVVGCHVMRRLPDPSMERNSRRFMLGLPHTGDRMGSSLRLGSDQSSWLTRAEVAVGSKSAPNRASAASLIPLWRHSRRAGGENETEWISMNTSPYLGWLWPSRSSHWSCSFYWLHS